MRIQAWHVVVLVIAFILLFGWKNLPNAARSLGESMRVFKTEVDQMKDDGKKKDRDAGEPPTPGEAVEEVLEDRDSHRASGSHSAGGSDTARQEYRRIERHGPEGESGTSRG